MRHWPKSFLPSSTGGGGDSTSAPPAQLSGRSRKSPRTNSMMVGAAAAISNTLVIVPPQSDDPSSFPVAPPAPAEWYPPAFQLQQPFQLQPEPPAPPPLPSSAMFHCPICLQGSPHAPVRQQCGHALCFSCTRQALSMFGACPLCRTQLLFVGTGARLQLGDGDREDMDAFGFSSPEREASAQARIPLLSFDGVSSTPRGAASLVAFDASATAREFHSDSELSLQLDNLSDFGDMIDLPELVASSDTEQRVVRRRPRAAAAAAARSSAVRKTRVPRRKKVATKQAVALANSAEQLNSQSAMPAVVAVAASAVVIGSGTKKRKRKTPELADDSMAWTLVHVEGEPPAQRYDSGFAVFEDMLLVVGGIVDNKRLNDLYVLEMPSENHSAAPVWKKPLCSGPPPPPGFLLQPFVIGETLYVIGGTTDGKFLNELHAMNLTSGEWQWERLSVAGTPPSMRYWHSVTVLDGLAILYGGYGHPQRLSDTFALRFDSGAPTWTELHPSGDLPGSCSTHSVFVYDHKMYIFGGYDGKARRSQLHAFQILSRTPDSIECSWEQVTTLGRSPAPRYTHSSVVIGSKVIVYGGNSGCLKGDVHVLEFDGVELPTWKVGKCDHAPPPREWHSAVVHGDAMFVFGGHTAEGNENALFRLARKPTS